MEEEVWKLASTHVITALCSVLGTSFGMIYFLFRYILKSRKDQIERDDAWHDESVILTTKSIEANNNSTSATRDSVNAMNNLAKLVDKQTEHNDATMRLIMQALLNRTDK